MEYAVIKTLLDQIKGCTFATLDSVTYPLKDVPGFRHENLGVNVILFTNKNGSGYENMVRRRLTEAGKNPDDFVLSDLPWGQRLPNSPIIECRGEYYLQTIVLDGGKSRYFLRDTEVNPDDFLPRRRPSNQGLGENSVVVHTYKLSSITRIILMGEELVADSAAGMISRI